MNHTFIHINWGGAIHINWFRHSPANCHLPPFVLTIVPLFTLTVYVTQPDSVSRLHRIQSDEVWHFYSGGPMTVVELDSSLPDQTKLTVLGPNDEQQYVVKAGTWFGSYPNAGTEYSLVGCTVSPGFDFEDFELASPDSLKKDFPHATSVIDKLTVGLTNIDSTKRGGARTRKPSVASNLAVSHPVFRASANEKPRQLLLSLSLFCTIVYFGWTNTELADDRSAFQNSIIFGFIAFQMFVFLQVRDLITVWPHPGFWRLVFGAGAFYALVLVAMLMLDFTRARWILEGLLGDIGSIKDYERKTQEVAEVMSSCYIDRNNIGQVLYQQIFGAPWFLSHALGWMGKMMIFRDWKVCLIAAVFFEFTEMTLMYVCPEFTECWWDSIFLDTFGANILGMWIGTHVNRWMVAFSKKRRGMSRGGDAGDVGAVLDWAGKEEREGKFNSIHAVVNPMIYDSTYSWTIFKNPLRLFQVCVLIGVMLFIETNTFLMMNTMGIPHDSWYNKARLALFGFLSIPAAAEWYVYMEQTARAGTDIARIGPACWLCFCIALLENCLFWKFFPKHFVTELDKLNGWIPIPTDTLIKHLSFWFLFLLWGVLRYKVVGYEVEENELDDSDREAVYKLVSGGGKGRRKASLQGMVPEKVKDKIWRIELVDVLLYVSIVPLLALGTNWKFD